MLRWIRASYQDVIEVSIAKSQAMEDLIYEALESLSCIPWNLDDLEETKVGCNGCLRNVLGGYRDVVLSLDIL